MFCHSSPRGLRQLRDPDWSEEMGEALKHLLRRLQVQGQRPGSDVFTGHPPKREGKQHLSSIYYMSGMNFRKSVRCHLHRIPHTHFKHTQAYSHVTTPPPPPTIETRKHFYHPEIPLCPFPVSLHPQPWPQVSTDPPPVSTDWIWLPRGSTESHTPSNTAFCGWLPPLSLLFLRTIHSDVWINGSFFLLISRIPLYVYM